METKLELNSAVLVETHARIVRGLEKGGALILEDAVLMAPTEPEPRHGVHLRETGFVTPESGSGGVDRVMVGFRAFWAPFQEVNEYEHPHGGESHFLEKAFLTHGEAALEAVATEIRAE